VQDFEFELVGSHNLKILVCSKSLLKEETHAHGKMRVSQLLLNQCKVLALKNSTPAVPYTLAARIRREI